MWWGKVMLHIFSEKNPDISHHQLYGKTTGTSSGTLRS